MMTIEETGRGMFMVTSHGQPWTVDLLWYRGHGKCDCWQFTRKDGLRSQIEERIKAGSFEPGTPELLCPHIELANRVLLQKFKKELIRQFPDSERDGA